MVIKITGGVFSVEFDEQPAFRTLSSKAVQRSSLPRECMHDVSGGNRLSLSVFGVGNGVTDDGRDKGMHDLAGRFVNRLRDSFHTASPGQAFDGWQGDTLAVQLVGLHMTLGASLLELFSLGVFRHGPVRVVSACSHLLT